MSQTPQTPEDDAFVARLRAAYDQHPAHTAPARMRTPASTRHAPVRRWLAIGAVVATAAAVPIAASSILDRDGSSTTAPIGGTPTSGTGAPVDLDLPRRCRATELVVKVGDDLRLPGDRSGRVVRLTTEGDAPCRIDARVTVTSAIGPDSDPAPPERSRVVVPREAPFVVAPGRDVAFMTSSESCDSSRPRGGAPRRSVLRFTVQAGVAGTQIGFDPGSVGTCGQLAVDWVVVEGFDSQGRAWPLEGRITAPDGLVVGRPSRIVGVARNTSHRERLTNDCDLRVLPGQGLEIADESCDVDRAVLPQRVRTWRLTRQFTGSLAGRSFAFTIDGVSAKVTVVTIQPRG